MICMGCGYPKTIVADSREWHDKKITYRRRQCPKCDYRFTTYEQKIDVPQGQHKKKLFNEAIA